MRPLIPLLFLSLALTLLAACGGTAQAPTSTSAPEVRTDSATGASQPSNSAGSAVLPTNDAGGSVSVPAPDASAAMSSGSSSSAAMPATDASSSSMPAGSGDSTSMPATDTTSSAMPASGVASESMPAADTGPAPMAGPTGDLVLALRELNASGQQGLVVFTAKGATTEVSVLGNAGISQANHIHSGSCAVLGGVVHALTSLVDGKGVTTVNTTLDSLLTGGFAVNLHKTGAPATYTACADIPAKASFVTVQLNEMNASSQSGVASLVAKGAATEVVLYATPGISSANHIHSGSCMALGGVLHALTPMSGGMSITTVNAAFADLTKGGMAINLHQTANPAIYTACGDIPMIAPAGGTAEGAAATAPVSPVVGLQAEVKNYVLPTLNVNVGTTVTWAQRDLEGHTVTAPGLFDSGILDEGKTFSYTFTKAGTYTYTCTLHPSMTGTITVGEPSMAPIDTGY